MTVRGRILSIDPRPGGLLEIEITAEIPEQERLTEDHLRFVYPQKVNKPTSLSTIRRWVKQGYFEFFEMGGKKFFLASRLPDKVQGIERQALPLKIAA